MLLLNRGQSAQFKFIFVSEGAIYDPTATIPETDVYFSVIRGSNNSGAVVDGPFSYLKQDAYVNFPGTVGSYIFTPDSNDLDILGVENNQKYFNASGVASNWASTPHHSSFVDPNLEIVLRFSLTEYKIGTSNKRILSKRNNAAGQSSYELIWGTGGSLQLWTYTDGSSAIEYFSGPTVHPFVDNTTYWVRIRRYGSIGTMEWAQDQESEPTSWTTLASNSGFSTYAPFNGSAPLGIGGLGENGTNGAIGSFYRVIIRTGSQKTTVFDADFSKQSIETTSFTESTGKLVTINGSSSKIVDGSTFLTLPGTTGNYASAPDSAQVDILGVEGTKFLSLPGTTGNYAITADTTGSTLDITGDIDIIVRAGLDNWKAGDYQNLISKRGAVTAAYAFRIGVGATGYPEFVWWNGGIANTITATGAPVFTNGQVGWLRCTFTVANRQATFYYSTQTAEPSGAQWTQISQSTAGAATTIDATNDSLYIGSASGATQMAAGKFYNVIIKNGVGGTTVYNADFTLQTIGASSFAETYGKTVTVTGAASKIVDGSTYLALNGVNASYASRPTNAILDITGDIEIVFKLTPSISAANMGLMSRSGHFRVLTDITDFTKFKFGRFNGTSWNEVVSNTGAISNNVTSWIKLTRDQATGTVNFYTAADQVSEPTTWTPAGSQVLDAGVALTPAAANLEIGSRDNGIGVFKGKIHRAILRSGIAGSAVTVFDADFTRQVQFATSFTENTANAGLVTINGTGARLERDRSFEVVSRVAIDSLTAADARCFVGKWTTGGNQRSYAFGITSTGLLSLWLGSDGLDNGNGVSSSLVGVISTKTFYWFKATYNNATRLVSFFWANDSEAEPTSWNAIGTSTTTINTVYPGTAVMENGSIALGTLWNFSGKIKRNIIRNGISGVKAADFDFTNQIQFSTTMTEKSYNLGSVTVNGSGARIERLRNIEVVVRASLSDWTPTTINTLLGKWKTSPTAQRSYWFFVAAGGQLIFQTSSDGVNNLADQAGSIAPNLADGKTYWLKVTKNVMSGLTSFYKAEDQTDEPTNWTLISSSTPTYPGSSFVGTGTLEVGSVADGSSGPASGKIYRAIVRNGIDGAVVADMTAFRGLSNKTFFTDPYNKKWTLVGSAQLRVSSRVDSTYIEKTGNYEFVLNYTVPSNFFEGTYSIVAQTANSLNSLSISSGFQVKTEPVTLNPTIVSPNRSTVVNYRPSFDELNQSNTSTLLLIGHADGIELNNPIKIRSVQSAIDLLRADMDSPLLRGVFDAYAAGARDIIICAAAPMSEYVLRQEDRLISTTLFDLSAATPSSYTFYQKYYERLATTYSILEDLDFIDMIVPLEASILKTGNVDFVTQLSNYLADFHNNTGYVQLGVIGSRTSGFSSEDIDLFEANPVFKNKFTKYTLQGNISSDNGRFVIPVYGEGTYQHDYLKVAYTSSVAASVAGKFCSSPLDTGLIRSRIPGIMSIVGPELSHQQVERLEALGINTIYKGKRARRAIPFEVYLTNEYTMANSQSTLSKAAQMRLVSRIVSEVRGFAYHAIGNFGSDIVIGKVRKFLEDLKRSKIILDFSFNVELSATTVGKMIFYIEILSALGLKKINFAIAAGPGA